MLFILSVYFIIIIIFLLDSFQYSIGIVIMARSIPSAPVPPPLGHLLGMFSLPLPHGGAFAKEGKTGGGALLSKTTRSFGL